MRGVTREEIVEAAKKAARRCKGPVTLRALARYGGISFTQVYQRFPGGWFAVLKEAGLIGRAVRRVDVRSSALMQEFHRLACEVGRMPTQMEMRLSGKFGWSMYVTRFGSLRGTWAAYRRWCRGRGVRAAGGGVVPRRVREHRRREGPGADRTRSDGLGVTGRPLVFRGIANEPVNEMGVVHLFGMVCVELGYVVVRVGSRFPDCTALRNVDGKEGLWETVRVEFEFRSSGFRVHGHDARKCDVVVCWEHDWPGCPLEVVELRSVVGRLRAA